MIAAPVGIPVIQSFQMSIILSLLLNALANSGDCRTAGSTCAVVDAVPAMGEALLQLPAKLQQTAPQKSNPEETLAESLVANPITNHQHESAEAMMQKSFGGHAGALHRGDGLPAEAKKLFNEKLCKAQPAAAQRPPKSPEKNGSLNENMLLGKKNVPGTKSLKKNASGEFSQKEHAHQKQPKESFFSKNDFSLDDAAGNANLQSYSASLDQAGFAKVRKLSNEKDASSEEMAMFIRRVAESCNMMVIDEGGLNGAVDWFKNPDDAGATFEQLKADLFRALLAASRDHWVTVKDVKGITADTATLDLLGYVQVRALRKKKQTIQFVKRMVAEMGIKITDMDGFNGVMVYYSEPDDSESFGRLSAEIKKAAYERKWAEME